LGSKGVTRSRRCRRRSHRYPRTRPAPPSAFAGYRFPPEVITLAISWYLRFGLSYRDVEELLAERGIEVDHVTVYRWVQRFAPEFAEAAAARRHVVGDRWHVDETYLKVGGTWRYLFRAIDQFGQVIGLLLSPRRNREAARRFFARAIDRTRISPVEVTTDRYRVYPASSTSCCRWRSMTRRFAPTTPSRPTTDVSRHASDRCEG
jgi:transposase-like protein